MDPAPSGERRSLEALPDHELTAREFAAMVRAIPAARWHSPAAPGKWTPAEEALHVALTYELGFAMLADGAVMRPRVSRGRAWLLRWLVLPVVLRTRWFPRAKAPVEVRPVGEGGATTPEAMADRIERAAAALGVATRAADPRARLDHAYFGPLSPEVAMRLLGAHTRHHHRALMRAAEAMGSSRTAP